MENQQTQTSSMSIVNEITATPTIEIPTTPSDSLPSKKNKWIKGIIVTIFSLIVLNYSFFYLPHVLNLFTKDIPSPEYSDLKLEKIVIADNENAYFDLQKTEDVLYYPDEASTTIYKMATGKEWDDKIAEDLISKNSQTFEYLNQALNKSKFQYPQFADPETVSAETPSIPLNLYRKIANLKSIETLNLLKQNRGEDAFNNAFILLSFGQMIENSQGNLISYLISRSVKNMGVENIQKIINSSTSTSEELIKYSKDLNNYKNDKENFATAIKMENYFLINNLTNLSKEINSGLKNTSLPFNSKRTQANAVYYFKLDKTKKIIIDDTRSKLVFLNEPLNKEFPETEKLVKHYSDGKISLTLFFIKQYFTENAIGKMLVSISAMPYSEVRRKSVELPISATQLILSLKAFNNDKGVLPNSLNDLVPDYISSIPLDPYDGKQLRYSKEKKIIYSVGTSTEDVGGSDGANWQTMKNPTFRFDF